MRRYLCELFEHRVLALVGDFPKRFQQSLALAEPGDHCPVVVEIRNGEELRGFRSSQSTQGVKQRRGVTGNPFAVAANELILVQRIGFDKLSGFYEHCSSFRWIFRVLNLRRQSCYAAGTG